MEEKTIFKGAPSQLANLGFYFFCLILLPVLGFGLLKFLDQFQMANLEFYVSSIILLLTLGLGLIMFFVRFFKTKGSTFELTDERIIEQSGILSRRIDETELYRVKDIRLEEPLILRMFGLSNIFLITSDKTSPIIKLCGIKNGNDLRKEIRKAVENVRDKKGIKER